MPVAESEQGSRPIRSRVESSGRHCRITPKAAMLAGLPLHAKRGSLAEFYAGDIAEVESNRPKSPEAFDFTQTE
jgi:hypothetical protein